MAGRVCAATRYARLHAPLVADADEEDGRRIVRMDEQALRLSMGTATSPFAAVPSMTSSSSQFDRKVYGSVDYAVVVPPDGLASRGGTSAAQVELKLWVNVKSSDSDSLFVSVDGSEFMSWHVNASDEFQWRKFWKNVPLAAGPHTVTLGFKYPQMYLAHVWVGTGVFQPISVEEDTIVHSGDEDEVLDIDLPGGDDGSDSEGGASRADGRGGGNGTGSGGRKKHHVTRSSLSAAGTVSSSTLDPEIAKYYINTDGADAAAEEVAEEKEPDPLSQSYAQ
jgi:hypothetical protein